MSPALLVIGALTIALLAAVLAAVRARRQLGRVAAAVGVASSEDVVVAAAAAVAARDRAVQEFEARDRELGQLAELLGVGVLHLDDDEVVRFANSAACAFLDRPPGGLEGRTVMEAFADHEVESRVRAARERGAACGEVSPHGERGRVLTLRARRGSTGGTWVALEDITELRRLRRIRTEFVDNLSHELRTPLTSVRLLTETL
ncbi:MAG: histidine kinase dimerization/phospho-acceptor domain-containing protein, partial [Candidatus Limnocylindrales bacterium]